MHQNLSESILKFIGPGGKGSAEERRRKKQKKKKKKKKGREEDFNLLRDIVPTSSKVTESDELLYTSCNDLSLEMKDFPLKNGILKDVNSRQRSAATLGKENDEYLQAINSAEKSHACTTSSFSWLRFRLAKTRLQTATTLVCALSPRNPGPTEAKVDDSVEEARVLAYTGILLHIRGDSSEGSIPAVTSKARQSYVYTYGSLTDNQRKQPLHLYDCIIKVPVMKEKSHFELNARGYLKNCEKCQAIKVGKVDKKVCIIDRVDKVDRVDRVDRVGKVARVDRVNRVDRVDRVDRADRVDRVGRVGKVDRVDEVDKVRLVTFIVIWYPIAVVAKSTQRINQHNAGIMNWNTLKFIKQVFDTGALIIDYTIKFKKKQTTPTGLLRGYAVMQKLSQARSELRLAAASDKGIQKLQFLKAGSLRVCASSMISMIAYGHPIPLRTLMDLKITKVFIMFAAIKSKVIHVTSTLDHQRPWNINEWQANGPDVPLDLVFITDISEAITGKFSSEYYRRNFYKVKRKAIIDEFYTLDLMEVTRRKIGEYRWTEMAVASDSGGVALLGASVTELYAVHNGNTPREVKQGDLPLSTELLCIDTEYLEQQEVTDRTKEEKGNRARPSPKDINAGSYISTGEFIPRVQVFISSRLPSTIAFAKRDSTLKLKSLRVELLVCVCLTSTGGT
ncbi:Major royal jelly protein 5 [Melipona quadrifasciata]|uniref:Major royal jelly protein 5 n=1 Tax=Melipona quadrifasciata TaxID=166423 RepID=A0A0M9A3C8_9HYME|nr:Major royal jelly protein 5 [Melipona quadrifasciata]